MDSCRYTTKQWISIVLFFLTLLISEPYIITLLLGISNKLLWVAPILLLFVISLSSPREKMPHSFVVCCILQIFVWFLFSLLHNDTSYITRIAFIVFTLLLLSSVDRVVGLHKINALNNKLIAIQSVLGALAFVLVFMGILGPIMEFSLFDSRPSYYYGITCSNVLIGNIIRPAGFFDEPGALACWGVYALVVNKLFYDNKKLEYILAISLLFTLSLAFYIQLTLYILLFYGKNAKMILPFVILLIIAVLYISSDTSSELYRLTLGRISSFSEGGLNSTTRGVLTEISKGYFERSPWIGVGARTTEVIGVYSSDNPYETLGRDGIIGTITLYLPLLSVLTQKKDKYIWAGVCILIVGYLQRPFHLNILHYVMMYGFCILALRDYNHAKC